MVEAVALNVLIGGAAAVLAAPEYWGLDFAVAFGAILGAMAGLVFVPLTAVVLVYRRVFTVTLCMAFTICSSSLMLGIFGLRWAPLGGLMVYPIALALAWKLGSEAPVADAPLGCYKCGYPLLPQAEQCSECGAGAPPQTASRET